MKYFMIKRERLVTPIKPLGDSQDNNDKYNVPMSTRLRLWTFGSGSVIRRIWPTVLMHILFATAVTSLTMLTPFRLVLPNVLLMVLGVILGFVISYRAISGYDRYWMGRTAWSDLVRNARTLSRLIWFHVPPCYKPLTPAERKTGHFSRPEGELEAVMREKRMTLDLIEGFAVALKHHVRGESGIYFEDLYDLVVPLHNTNQEAQTVEANASHPELASSSQLPSLPERQFTAPHVRFETAKYHPTVASHAENLPLDILKTLSEWFSVLEDRGTVPGTSLGAMIGAIATFEDILATLEKILTTPLPYVYAVHIRHTVWIYLFFLPFQLVEIFEWYSIPGTAIAAFIYLGFVAAGEEIEQPFGYDENDLDLDLFCNEVIHPEIEQVRKTPCRNAYFSPGQSDGSHMTTVAELTALDMESHT